MIGSTQNKAGYLSIASLEDGLQTRINSSIVRMSVDYTMTMASELSFDVIDIGGEMIRRNYFQIGRDVLYTTNTLTRFADEFTSLQGSTSPGRVVQAYEMSNITISEGPGYNPIIQVKCYTKSIQQMRRDRNPGSVKGDGAEFVKNAARKYGLKCFAEKTSKKKQITKAAGSKQAESLWDVLGNLAQESEFVLFETDGILFFCSQKFLVNKWGSEVKYIDIAKPKPKGPKREQIRYVPIVFGDEFLDNTNKSNILEIENLISAKNNFDVLKRPSITRSDNDPLDATGSIVVGRTNGTQIRPGMTIRIFDDKNFSGDYLVDTVSFEDISPNPVSISFRKPEKTKDEITKQIRIGKRFKATTRSGFQEQPLPIQISKNTKQNKNYTDYESVRKNLQISPSELPVNLKPDQRINPLPINFPNKLHKFRYPRISGALAYGTSASVSLNMFNRPIAINNSRPSALYALAINVQSQPGFNNEDPYVAVIPRVTFDEEFRPVILDDATASVEFINACSASLNPSFVAKLPNVEVVPSWYTGNIDLFSRPVFTNPDKSIDTILGFYFFEVSSGKQVLIPRIIYPDFEGAAIGIATEAQAQTIYMEYGQHLGKFDTAEQATEALQRISAQQEEYYSVLNKLENPNAVTAKSIRKAKQEDYIKLCNLQEVQVIANRFGINTLLPESSIYPIPTSASPSLYPYMGTGLISAGNIPLYTRPLSIVNGELRIGPSVIFSFKEDGVNGNQPFFLILSTVFSSGGNINRLSSSQALDKYKLDGLFLAKCTSMQYAEIYEKLLTEQFVEIMFSRFPDGNFTETP